MLTPNMVYTHIQLNKTSMLGSTRHTWLYTGCMVRGANRGTWVDDLLTRSSSELNDITA